MRIQQSLNVPKGQFNSFGGYKYRSCEDILSALKPLLREHGCSLIMEDEIIEVGGRVYVKAIVTLMDGEKILQRATASAREAQSKKGMDEAQITGAASSYARKYALSGMFLIDDGVDPDKMDNTKEGKDSTKKADVDKEEQARTKSMIEDCQSLADLKKLWSQILSQGKAEIYEELFAQRGAELKKKAA